MKQKKGRKKKISNVRLINCSAYTIMVRKPE
jgi:hypothetical protein